MALIVWYLIYPLMHELGHGIIAKILGANIYNIKVVLSPHVEYGFKSNIILSSNEEGFIELAGVIFPYLLWIIVMIKSKLNNIIVYLYNLFQTLINITIIILWIIIPQIYQRFFYSRTNDITNFIIKSKLSCNSISIAFFMLLIIMLVVIILKREFIEYTILLIKYMIK